MEEAVGKMKSGKAPGEDRITAELLKGVNGKCITALWLMFKRCYETEEIPEEWARGLVVPIPKTADGKIENYRGISLMGIVGKIFITVLNTRLKKWMERNKVIVEEQAGFREGHAKAEEEETILGVPGHQASIRCSMERRVVGQVMDMWCEGENVADGATSVQKNGELCGRGRPKTEWKASEVGVRQGCVMSPNLFQCSSMAWPLG